MTLSPGSLTLFFSLVFMAFYTESRIVIKYNCHVERTFLVRFTAGPVNGREGVLNGGWATRSKPLPSLYNIFCWEKSTLFVQLLLKNGTPFTYLYFRTFHPFNCCNSLSLKYSWIDPITRTFLRLFHSDKMHLSLFTTEISDFLTLSYTSRGEIPGYPFMYLKPEKVAHFGRSLPV